MRKQNRMNLSAMVISGLALFAALGGSVYAAARINGRAIRVKSLPGNRIKPHSIPANRLKRGILAGVNPTGLLTGADINELTLGQVPEAAHSEAADSATQAQTAVNAVNAINAETVNGHRAGCIPDTVPFAGACWQSSPQGPDTAPVAAAECASQGGALPEALQLAAFAEQAGVDLAEGDEWSGDISGVSGVDLYSVVTVSPNSEINFELSSNNHEYRCVIPLVT